MYLRGKHVHFMGIGGIGVSALAEMAQLAGAIVSGCDRSGSAMTERLREKNITVFIGHDPIHVLEADLVVHSSAIPPTHPELAASRRRERRGEFLARFLDEENAWGISGTHGKTTTSWLLAHVLISAGLDPSVFIGGMAPMLDKGNYRIGTGPFVSELDESDATFLAPRLRGAIITNIESDHLSHYGTDTALHAAFRRFAAGVSDGGCLITGVDNAVAAKIHNSHTGYKVSFGFCADADLQATDFVASETENRFRVSRYGRDCGVFSLPLPGKHNILNALAAIAAALELGVDIDAIRKALASATGVARRLERLGTIGGAVLYTDYAHHPTEVAATIAAIRDRHRGRLLVVFQPHLFSRTRDHADGFAEALSHADSVLLSEIYPAREAPLPGVSAELIADGIRLRGGCVSGPYSLEQTGLELPGCAAGYEVVVAMGAGDIDALARRLAERDQNG